MHGLTIVKSLLIRVFLLAHGLICTWRVIDTIENPYCWILLVGLGFLLIETGIVIWLRNGREFKTIAICIIFYLTCTIPSLWIIHIDTANRKLYHLAEKKLNARATTTPSIQARQQNSISNSTSSDSSLLSTSRLLLHTNPVTLSIGHMECHDKAWYYMDEQRWLDAIQETMLIILSICRLLITREHMTVAKSGIVLIITFINGADLLAMSHSIQYHDVIIEHLWMYIGLALLSIGLFQMSFIDTDGLTSTTTTTTNQITSYDNQKKKLRKRIHFLRDQNICPLFRVLFINDGLFLLYRTLLATKVRCSKPTIIFFMAKNVLMITLHCYRVYHRSKEHAKKKTFAAYEHLINSSTLSRKHHHHHPFYDFERKRLRKHQQRLLHQTIRRPISINHRRRIKTPRTLETFSNNSTSYPFARRRNDGGRARTAFALYGLPFHTSQVPRPSTRSSSDNLVAKAIIR